MNQLNPAAERESTRRVLSHEGKVTTYIYPKTRRHEVVEGTRTSNVLVSFGGGAHFRKGIMRRATEVAIQEWERRWLQELPWPYTSIHVFHTHLQVIVEVRVEPT